MNIQLLEAVLEKLDCRHFQRRQTFQLLETVRSG